MTREALDMLRKIAASSDDLLDTHLDAVDMAKNRLLKSSVPQYNSYNYQQRPSDLVVGTRYDNIRPSYDLPYARVQQRVARNDQPSSANNTSKQPPSIKLPTSGADSNFGLGSALIGTGLIAGGAYLGSRLLPENNKQDTQSLQQQQQQSADPVEMTGEDSAVDAISSIGKFGVLALAAWRLKRRLSPGLMPKPVNVPGSFGFKTYTWGRNAINAARRFVPAIKTAATTLSTPAVAIPAATVAGAVGTAVGTAKLAELNPEEAKAKDPFIDRKTGKVKQQYPGGSLFGANPELYGL